MIRKSKHYYILFFEFNHSFIHSFIRSFIHSFIYSFILSSIQSFIHSFIHSLIHSFIYSLIHSFTHSKRSMILKCATVWSKQPSTPERRCPNGKRRKTFPIWTFSKLVHQIPLVAVRSFAGLHIIESPLPHGGEIKGFGDGEENQKGEKEKKRILGENITFGSTKS